MVINSSDPNIIQKIDTHSYKGLSLYLKTLQQGTIPSFVTLRTVTYVQMIVNLTIKLIRKFSFCKIEFLYYRNLSSSARDTIICDYNQSARIRLKIPVACLVLLGMICITISALSHFCMYVYCNTVFDNTVSFLQPQFMFMLGVGHD